MFRCLKSSAKLNESCHRDIDCSTIEFAECKNGKCKCQDNFTAMGEIKCVPLLGEFCFKNDDCIIQNFSCVDNKCQCQKNFIALKENECTELKLGKSCQSHEDWSEITNSKSYEYN
ncbi:uncharacterized protein LOC141531930 [Cotesia typhae]|uniref:uncharacterized protein LOC141531930 n=1 Tax=Cotesia typhae TaxID=2053667 RepID=UPI003D68916D